MAEPQKGHHSSDSTVKQTASCSNVKKGMSGKDCDKENCSTLEVPDFKNALKQFQILVEKTVAQKTKERLGLRIEDDDEMIDYDKFYTTTQTLFGPEVKDHNVKAFFRKINNNLDARTEWCEIFGYFIGESDGTSSQTKDENMIFLLSEKQQIPHAVLKRQDVITSIVKVPHLNFTVTSSQKGILTIFDNQMSVLATITVEVSQNSELHNQSVRGPGPEDIEPERLNTAVLAIQSSGLQTSEFSQHDECFFHCHHSAANSIAVFCPLMYNICAPEDTDWIAGCDFLHQLKFVVAVTTERTIIVWDYKSKGRQNNGFIIKPMENGLLCVCTVTKSDDLAKDTILMGDDKGYVYLLNVTADQFGLKRCKGKKESQLQALDSKTFNIVKRKLHDDWVMKVKYISELNCFGSCSSDSIHSFILDDIKRLKDNLPVKEFSVPKGVNAFTYCAKAKVIVTGGHDKLLRLWHPVVNSKPSGKLSGHQHSVVELVTNEKDQQVISLSSTKIFRVWDLQTLSLLQVFHDDQGSPGEMEASAMVFDNDNGTLITGSTVIDIYPLTQVIQDRRQLPQTHEKKINVLIYNMALHQILTVCSESILKVWDLETGYQIYQIEDAHGLNIEVTCAAFERKGVYLATGACDALWDKSSNHVPLLLVIAQNLKSSAQTCLLSDDVSPEAVENAKHGEIATEITTEMNALLSEAVEEHSPILASAHDNGSICLWSIQQIKEELCWRAHPTEVVDLFHEEEKNVVVTASIDGSVRLWHAMNGYYIGYFGQPRTFDFSDISRLILPSDVNSFPIIIKEESKHMEKNKKFEYPLVLDRDKWKSLTRSPSAVEKPKLVDVIQDMKFFKALASPKVANAYNKFGFVLCNI
ncbi:Wdr64 [Columba livia]|nr:Wdr64 [Columba livia]